MTSLAAAVAPAHPIKRAEILHFPGETMRAWQALHAFAQRAPQGSTRTTTYVGDRDWLLLWGPGAPNRWPIIAAHLAKGGHVICCDLAYWDRQHKVRLSIDRPHPSAWVMTRDWPATRLDADQIPLCDEWNPAGPILIAGIGEKAQVQYGAVVGQWEADQRRACEARWPGRPVIYRAKPKAPAEQILGLLRGVSLVMTWHSNVAVDAIRMGIPVVCRDGAAAAVCPSEIPEAVAPLPAPLRRRFLQNLSYFQYNPATEAALFWGFIQELLA